MDSATSAWPGARRGSAPPTGIEFQCVTELLAAGARRRRGRRAARRARPHRRPGAVRRRQAFSYVTGRPDPGPWTVETAGRRVVLRTAHLVGRGDPRSLAARFPDRRRPAPDPPGAGRRQLRRPALRAAARASRSRPCPTTPPAVRGRGRDPAARSRGSLLRRRRAVRAARPSGPDHPDLEPEPVRRPLGDSRTRTSRSLVGSRGYGLFVDVPTAVTFTWGAGRTAPSRCRRTATSSTTT